MPRTHWRPTNVVKIRRILGCVVVSGLGGFTVPLAAQPMRQAEISLSVVSDYRLRGISWSSEKPTIVAGASVPIGTKNLVHATSFLPRQDARAGGANIAFRFGGRHNEFIGPVRVDAGASCRVFAASDGRSFCELEAGGSFDLATATIYAEMAYAYKQSAIGGDNLYLGGGASLSIPQRPVTFSAYAGRSVGKITNPQAAARLRPFGDYWDYGAAVTLTNGRLSLIGRYIGTSSSAVQISHQSTGRLVAEARLDL